MTADQMQSIELPADVVEQVESRLPRTEFDSAGEYIAFVLEEVAYRVETKAGDEAFEAIDEGQVQDRLESLGYLNE